MPDVRVVRSHSLPVAAAKGRLAGFAEVLGRYGARLEWAGDTARVAGVPGIDGRVEVTPADVKVHLHVSRMLTVVGLDPVRLEGSIRRRLDEAFAAGA